MPFPLAHPAAVLPLKRFCPHWLNLPALVVGALCPDAAYLFGELNLAALAHKPLGIVAFCLPAGLFMLVIFCALRRRLLTLLPPRSRAVFLPEQWRPAGLPVVVVASVLLGSATHVLWDSFTHPGGRAVELFPVLTTVLGSFAGYNVRLCRLLWYASSFVGVAAVYLAYRAARFRSCPAPAARSGRRKWLEAALVATLVLPIELLHDLIQHAAGGVVVAGLSLLLVGGVLWYSQARPAREKPRPTL